VLKERDKMLGTILAKKGPLDAAEVQFVILKLIHPLHVHYIHLA
jgi:hypothetical protein